MTRTYTASVTVRIETDDETEPMSYDPIDSDELKTFLQNAVVLDLDTETYGNMGITDISVDWDYLQEG